MSASGASWRQGVRVAGQKVIEADPRIVDAFKNMGYSLSAAVTALVDNSVDTEAPAVLTRSLDTEDELVSPVVVDDVRGMRDKSIERAMHRGGRRDSGDTYIGIYGMGLKSASLIQADNVTVLSKVAPSGQVRLRWTEAQAKAGWKCQAIPQGFAAAEFQSPRLAGPDTSRAGTLIRQGYVRDFQKAAGHVAAYLRAMRLLIANHLCLQLHRFPEDCRPSFIIDAENLEFGEIGAQTVVIALDPFSYPMTGSTRYPKKSNISIPGAGGLEATSRIWPARTKSSGYKLEGGVVRISTGASPRPPGGNP